MTSIRRAALATGAAGALAAAALVPVSASAAASTPFLSELHYDNAGTDEGEAVEVTAALGTDLTGWSVVLYNGASSSLAPYDTRPLTGVVDAPAADPSGDGTVVLTYAANGIQNGSPDGLALVDPAGTVVEFLSYEGSFTAASGPAAGLTSVDIGVTESGSEPPGQSLQKVDGSWAGPATATFGEVNDTVGLGGGGTGGGGTDVCAAEVTATIPQIQGSGTTTPLDGSEVVTRGVVTADTQPGLSGFFLQDPVGDGDPATSDGVFVFGAGLVDVQVGDEVAVRGTAGEFFTLTQVTGTAAEVCGIASVPAAATLPFPSTDAEREAFEGMLVTPSETLSVTGLFRLEQFGEVRLSSGGPLVQGTEAAAPGAPAAAVEAENRTREVILDDGSNTDLRSAGLAPPYLTVDDTVRVGDTAELGAHVLSFGFGNWRLQPATGLPDQVTWQATNPRTPAPEDVGGDVTVAAFNVLNYFVTLDDGTFTDPEPRGATTPADFANQEAKIVNALLALDADVVALQEIEYGVRFGKDADVALEALVAALNAAAPAAGQPADWAFVPTPDYVRAEPDVIQNAIVYRSGGVTTVGEAVSLGTDPLAWSNAREPVAQLFERDGDRFLVVSNHFKSKSPGGASGDNLDQGDGQGAFNADRTRQAQALAAATADLAAELGEDDVFLLGDFNAYGEEDPITTLEAAGYVDVVEGLDEFTYSFDQREGNLDHALLSAGAAAKATGVDIWQVNAAEPFAYQYDSGVASLYAPYPYRASDHNPIVVGFDAVPPLGTDVSLADVLAEDSFVDRNPDDYDLLEVAVRRVLAERPDSAVGVLADPTVPVTAFLPTDAGFLASLSEYLPFRVRTELGGLIGLYLLDVDALEQVLLYHVVPGATLDSTAVLASDGAVLTTAQGGTVEVDVTDGTITLIDAGTRFTDPVVGQPDVNAGQVQIGHGVDRVLVPFDVSPLRLRDLLRP
ncbi:MAG: ExeM/NucH family extracellular endonuclease [Kineosporiaceae bacterium]